MGKEDFDRFLGSRTVSTDRRWVRRKEQWLDAVAELYVQVEGWLDEYIKAMAIVCNRERRELVEDGIGRYAIDALRIECQSIELMLDPVGANVIGAFGRVDLNGPAGSVRLLLVRPQSNGPRITIRRVEGQAAAVEQAPETLPECVFKLATEPPAVEYLDLDQDLFLEMLMYVMGARVQPPSK